MRLALLAALLLTGCIDREVSRHPVAGSQRTERGTVQCNKGSGFCYGPGYNYMTGKIDFGFAMRPSCPGSQKAMFYAEDVIVTRASGKQERHVARVEESRYGKCA